MFGQPGDAVGESALAAITACLRRTVVDFAARHSFSLTGLEGQTWHWLIFDVRRICRAYGPPSDLLLRKCVTRVMRAL